MPYRPPGRGDLGIDRSASSVKLWTPYRLIDRPFGRGGWRNLFYLPVAALLLLLRHRERPAAVIALLLGERRAPTDAERHQLGVLAPAVWAGGAIAFLEKGERHYCLR